MIAGRKPAFSGKSVEGGLVIRSGLSAGAPSTKAWISRASSPARAISDGEQQQAGEDRVADHVAARLVAQHRRVVARAPATARRLRGVTGLRPVAHS